MSKVIAIVGAGPAGCATALACQAVLHHAQKEAVSVHLFDAASSKVEKVAIGETLPPAALAILQQLQLSHILQNEHHLACHGSCSLWGSDSPQYNDFLQEPLGAGYHLDRAYFNQQLQQAVKIAGLSLHHSYRLSKVQSSHQTQRLYFKTPQGDNVFNANFVVDASGISAAFARRLGVARNVFDQVISLSALIKCTAKTKLTSFTLIEAVEDGWWYTARLPNDYFILSLCTDTTVMQSKQLNTKVQWLKAFQKTRFIKEHIDINAVKKLTSIHRSVAPSAILSKVIGQHWLAVGDAASSYDSISSAGITKALQQGLQAGHALAQYFLENTSEDLVAYEGSVFSAFNQYIQLRDSLYRSETAYQDAEFWRHRVF